MDKNKKVIEIEMRARFDKNKHTRLKKFLDQSAKDLGANDKDVVFFILSDKLIKVVNNISKKSAKIVLKLNKIGKGSAFEEIEVPIAQQDFEKSVKLCKAINLTHNIMHSFQQRHDYLYKDVEIALKYSDIWGYHLELEMVVNRISDKEETENKIKAVAEELNVNPMTDDEMKKFTKKAESDYKKKNTINI